MAKSQHWTIIESSVTTLDGFDLSWLPDRAYTYLTPRILQSVRGTSIAVEAGPYVGTLPLTNGDILQFVPRAGLKAFGRMLLVSENLASELRQEFQDISELSYDDKSTASWEALLTRAFFSRLRQIEKESLWPHRTLTRSALPSPRGRVHVVPTLLALAKRKTNPVHCSFKQKTLDTPEHRVLGAASSRLLNLGFVNDADRAIAIRWASYNTRLTAREIEDVIIGLNERRYTGPRSYYIPALLMARLILAEAGIALGTTNTISSESLMVNMPALFEKYLRSLLSAAFSNRGFLVEKRDSTALTLFEDGGCKLIPDILISDSKRLRLILDAKYKPAETSNEADFYQMMSYLTIYQINTGVLISPTNATSQLTRTTRKTHNGFSISEIRLPLDNWEATESSLVEEVSQILAM